MFEIRILQPQDDDQWKNVLEDSFQSDFYHLPEYHSLAEQYGEGDARLLVASEGEFMIAVPLLVRAISGTLDLTDVDDRWKDATSVYGYAGPIASHSQIPPEVVRHFQAAAYEALREQNIVAVFSRLHPLIPQAQWLTGLGDCVAVGQTVSIDLTLSIDKQWAKYRVNHKRDIHSLQRRGATCEIDQSEDHWNEFIDIYYETMQRVQASNTYFFDRAYFDALRSKLGGTVYLCVCLLDNHVICGALFTLVRGIVQYHLGGTSTEYLMLAPMKMVFDAVRIWATQHGARVFHLGGGVGAESDLLFHFKAGFSDRRHEFSTWKWILQPDAYQQLCLAKVQQNKQYGLKPVSSNFFPAYRCPTVLDASNE
jgi:hypothetical protein